MAARYPNLHLRLHSRNPFVWISAVRTALRTSQIDETEITRFTEQALSHELEPKAMREVCEQWAEVELTS